MVSSARVVTLLFTDLVGSTEQLQGLGDDDAEKLRHVHFSLLSCTDRRRGRRGEDLPVRTSGPPVEPHRFAHLREAGPVTRFLPIRGEEPPGDTVVIIRAGVMAPDPVRRTATDSFEDFGVYLISVEAVLEGTVESVCRSSPRIGHRYGKVRLSTAGRLRSAGFVLLATFDRPHYDIALPELSDAALTRLVGCFDPAITNPGRSAPGVT